MKTILNKIIKVTRKVFIPVVSGLIVILTISHFVWKGLGSNEWKLYKDEDGVRVYTLKAPNSTLIKVKAVMRVKTSLASATFLLRGDVTTADDFGGKDFKVHQHIETPDLFLAYYSVKHVMPPPFVTREIVCLLNYSQDKKSKEVKIHVQAAPTKIPPSPNVERVKHLNNIFTLTPLPNGEINWEVSMDVDLGLFYPIFNLAIPDNVHADLKSTRDLVMTEKYQNAKLISVEELSAPEQYGMRTTD